MKEIYRSINVIRAKVLFEDGSENEYIAYGDYTLKQLKNHIKHEYAESGMEVADVTITSQKEEKFYISVDKFCKASLEYMIATPF